MSITCTYSECVPVFLPQLPGMHIASLFLRRGVLPCSACLAPPYFSTLSHKRHNYQGVGNIERKIRISHSDKNSTMYRSCRVKYQLFLTYINETWIIWASFRKILKCQMLWTYVRWEPSSSVRTDRHLKLIVTLRDFMNLISLEDGASW
jgi:hypothetical protein